MLDICIWKHAQIKGADMINFEASKYHQLTYVNNIRTYKYLTQNEEFIKKRIKETLTLLQASAKII